jgi:dihydrofolate synthase/folylpolyglutamate synthase
VSTLSYETLVAELFPRLTGGIRWGLERTRRLLAGVGDPHTRFPTLHVGGTNGKGSVAATLASVLAAGGRRVGLYTSPHLCTFRERIQIDGRAITEAALLAAAERLWPAIGRERPSFFEATTAIALLALAEADVDVAVVEVGLGGRLDATNVITPEVCVLTNVSLDHVQYLGSTVEAVAREKAGIIKAGVPVVTGEWQGVAHDVFRWRAAEVRAPLRALRPEQYRVDRLPPGGQHRPGRPGPGRPATRAAPER